MKCIFIRHGMTKGNIEGRYVGKKSDEPLLEKSKNDLLKTHMPAVDNVFSSPMIRCVQTAELLFPQHTISIVQDLSECDFGDFEYKNYKELSEEKAYQAYIHSNGETPFPNGESKQDFILRTVHAFLTTISSLDDNKTYAFVVHGGTIMAIMAHFIKDKDYFDFRVKNQKGYVLTLQNRQAIYYTTL